MWKPNSQATTHFDMLLFREMTPRTVVGERWVLAGVCSVWGVKLHTQSSAEARLCLLVSRLAEEIVLFSRVHCFPLRPFRHFLRRKSSHR